MRARQLGLTTSRLPSLDTEGEPLRLAPVKVEDLLLRPTTRIDYRRIESFVAGKAVAITGGGGSIGSEICNRLLAFRVGRLLLLENSEPALHAILEESRTKAIDTEVEGRIADVRDRQRVSRLITEFRPDLVLNHDMAYVGNTFLLSIRAANRLLVGQLAAPLPEKNDFHAYDLVISSLPNLVAWFRARGYADWFVVLFDSLCLFFLFL